MNCVKNSAAVMLMQDQNVQTVGQNYTAQAVVRQTHTMQADPFVGFTSRDVNCSASVLNVPL